MSTLTEPAPQPGLRHALTFRFDDLEFRKAQNGRSDNYTLRGHAAVFNSLSEDLGGFKELLAPGAFRTALRGTPDVRLLFNHDSNHVLARTTAKIDGKPSLELREDATGLHVWAVIQPRTWVNDLAIEMQSGLIDQMSFAFSLREGGDDWAVAEDGAVIRTIVADGVSDLYDVSVVTQPAYTATEVGIRELRNAVESGRLPATVLGEPADDPVSATTYFTGTTFPAHTHNTTGTAGTTTVIYPRSADPDSPQHTEVLAEETDAPDTSWEDFRAHARTTTRQAKERYALTLKEITK